VAKKEVSILLKYKLFLYTETTLTGLPTDLNQWVILNSKGRMYYRVHYDDVSRDAIVAELIANPHVSFKTFLFRQNTFILSGQTHGLC